jgi:hypothetical protein
MQKLCKSIKRLNLHIVGFEEEEEFQAKCIHDVFNKIIAENFPNLKKEMPIQVQEASGHQRDMTKIDHFHGILKQLAQRTRKEY